MRLSALLVLTTLLMTAPATPALARDIRPFELTMTVKRTDIAKTHQGGESRAVEWDSDLTIFGRVELNPTGEQVTFYADSIRYDSRSPRALHTFMSADTMYYRSPGGGGAIDHHEDVYESMLSCIFRGAALRVERDETGAPLEMEHLNADCPGGEYGRINLPVTMGAFLITARDGRDRWVERRRLPSFSGIGFHPDLEWLYRTVDTTDDEATVTVAADSTIEDFPTRFPSGEEITIVRDRIRIGGTLVIARTTGLPTHAEIRVGESLELVRPDAEGMIVAREGRYTIRFTLP